MMKFKIIGAAIAIAVILGAFKLYGLSEYRRGLSDASSAGKSATIGTLTGNADIWNEVRNEVDKITDRDAAAARLGILRPDELR